MSSTDNHASCFIFPPRQPVVFGYGSLVCPQRRAPDATGVPAVLHGWVRTWQGHYVHLKVQDGRKIPVCALTLRRSEGRSIWGVLLDMSAESFRMLEQQEIGYRREDVTAQVETDARWTTEKPINCYIGEDDSLKGEDPFIPLSYALVILWGYLNTFGERGLQHFLQTTEDWSSFRLLDDSASPIYGNCRDAVPDHLQRKLTAIIRSLPRTVVSLADV